MQIAGFPIRFCRELSFNITSSNSWSFRSPPQLVYYSSNSCGGLPASQPWYSFRVRSDTVVVWSCFKVLKNKTVWVGCSKLIFKKNKILTVWVTTTTTPLGPPPIPHILTYSNSFNGLRKLSVVLLSCTTRGKKKKKKPLRNLTLSIRGTSM